MRKRVLTGTILGLVLFGLGAAAMDRLLERQVARYQSLLDLLVPLQDKVDEMHLLLLQQRSLIERSAFSEGGSLQSLAEASEGFDEALAAAFTASFALLEQSNRLFSPTSAELREELTVIQEKFARHSRRLELMFDRLQGLEPETARSGQPLIDDLLVEATAIQSAVAGFEELLGAHYDDALASAADTRASVRRLFVAAVAAAMVLGTLANLFFYRSLLPLKSMVDAVREITRGRYEVQVPVEGGEEVAFLAGEFNTMVQALSEQRTAIQRSQEVIRTTFDGISDVLVVHDRHGKVLHANPAAQTLARSRGLSEAGCSRAILGLAGACPGVRDDAPSPGPSLEIVQDSQTGSFYELWYQRVSDDVGEVRFVVEFVRDITQKLELERFLRQSEKLTAIGELSLGVAHEVRNPLSTIQMTLHSIGKRQDLTLRERERLDLAMNEVGRLEGLVSSLLEYGRQSTPEVSAVDLRSLLERSIELVKTECVRSGVSVELGPVDPRLPRIEADADQMIQVMVNLLLNAIQASPRGERVAVEVSATSARRQREAAVVQVIDRGGGIDPKQLKHIFTPFFTTRKDGTGLGLPVARKIVEAHGGELTVDSTVGRGTTVSLTLPVHPLEVEPLAP